MSRDKAITRAEALFDDGRFFDLLARWVAFPTESQNEACTTPLQDYLAREITPYLEGMDFSCRIVDNPVNPRLPFLIGQRDEGEDLPTVLIYGHGDTVMSMQGKWREGLEPWRMIKEDDRWYGRGSADNKGQHAINLAALACILAEKGRLGFNVKVLIEMGEEMGSPGLHEICSREKESLTADVLIASDGPRIDPTKPTIFGGSRGVFNFDLHLDLREGGHHSGNWGGLLANPGIILANAISSMVDKHGRILIEDLKPDGIPESVRRALAELDVTGKKGPEIDPNWGEPGLSLSEKVYGWNTLEVIALECGNPSNPVHAIPPSAWAQSGPVTAGPPGSTRKIPGSNGLFAPLKIPAVRNRHFYPISAEPYPTMRSAIFWACRPSGYPIPTAAALSTLRMNIFWRLSYGKAFA